MKRYIWIVGKNIQGVPHNPGSGIHWGLETYPPPITGDYCILVSMVNIALGHLGIQHWVSRPATSNMVASTASAGVGKLYQSSPKRAFPSLLPCSNTTRRRWLPASPSVPKSQCCLDQSNRYTNKYLKIHALESATK